MGLVRVKVSEELLRQALAFPEDVRIKNVGIENFLVPDVFTFLIEGPDFPDTKEGESPREITPVFTADYDKRPETWISIDWSID